MISAVFLDRDGTICVDVGYLRSVDQVELFPESANAIKLLNEKKIPVIVVTNQSGVARGYFTEDTIKAANAKLKELLSKESVYVDDVYYCPHHPDDGCICRKPKIGMIDDASRKFGIDVKKSFVVGDKSTDIELGKNIGAKTILVLTGSGKEDKEKSNPDYIADNLLDAVKIILKDDK